MVEILQVIGYAVICALGVLSHFLKKKVKGETMADIKLYFRSHLRETITMVIAAMVGFIALKSTGDLGVLSAFTAGYSADSLFNKAAK